MKDNKDIVEQTENSVSKIGKFNTADDLLAAYNALESEFTKRCQLIKQLQAELDRVLTAQANGQPEPAATAQTSTVDAPEKEQTAAPPEKERAATGIATGEAAGDTADVDALVSAVVDEITRNAAAYAEALCGLPEIMDECVARYKQRLIETHVGPSPSGVAVIAPSARPRTLADAKILADKLIGRA